MPGAFGTGKSSGAFAQDEDPWRMNEVPVDRGFIAPLATYADGKTELAWPTFPVGAIIDGLRSFGSKGYDTPEAIKHNAGAALDVSGGAIMAGAGVGLAGGMADNALGSAGGRLAGSNSDLFMDLASRMARAKEMGFDTENQFYRGVAFANEPELVASQASGLANGPGVYVGNRPTASGYANQYTNYDNTLPGVYGPLVARGKLADISEFMDAEDAAKKLLPKVQRKDSQAVQTKAREMLIEQGYTGIVNGRGPSMTVGTIFDPKDIRSVNAAFDPDMSDSANLLAANAKSGAAVPLALDAAERSSPQGIKAYHGSPHDFDRFSLDKIGSGEGAQAYGHGLYFADSEDVARSYRDALATPYDKNTRALLTSTGSPDGVREWITSRGRQDEPFYKAILEDLDKHGPSQNPGRMYEVNINADPADFLDWDKPLSQQSEAVKAALVEKAKEAAARGSFPKADAKNLEDLLVRDVPASEFYTRNRNVFGRAEDASQALREAGIPGIRYLDGMSRGAGEGSSNYVVFDDALVDILRKYSNAPTGAAIPTGMEASQDPLDLQRLKGGK